MIAGRPNGTLSDRSFVDPYSGPPRIPAREGAQRQRSSAICQARRASVFGVLPTGAGCERRNEPHARPLEDEAISCSPGNDRALPLAFGALGRSKGITNGGGAGTSSKAEGVGRLVRNLILLERTNRELRREFRQVGCFGSPRGVEVVVYIQVTRPNAESGQVELVGGISLHQPLG